MSVERIEGEAMHEHPQPARIFNGAGSLNQEYRQRPDRILLFEAYEDEKRGEGRIGELARGRWQNSEELLEQQRILRAQRREEFARAFDQAPMSEAAADSAAAEDAQAGIALRKKLFSEIPCIEGERVVLDRVTDADADALRDLKENPAVQRYLPTFLFENQRDDVHETIHLMYEDLFESRESLILGVHMKDTGDLAGLVEFYGLRDDLHKVSVGGRLRESYWGCGIATEMVKLMVSYLYGETDIEIITASVRVENAASAHALENAGFIRTARNVEEDWGFSEPVVVDKFFC